jgi:hypothetical protein
MDELDFSPAFRKAVEGFHAAIIAKIDSGMPPPNAPSTVKRKGHGRTLIDSGKMRSDLTARIERSTSGDLFAEIGFSDPHVDEYAKWVHDGTGKGIPPRPFLSEAVDENEQRILEELENDCLEIIENFIQEV